jgi:tryptophan synthase alpha chain
MSRIADRFAELKKQNRSAFVPFVTAGDPNFETSLALLQKLPAVGADLIELGIPFSDPMADGPVNQASYLRALASGMTSVKVLDLVRKFRKSDKETPIILMGSYNPIHAYGTARFTKDAAEAGIDGFLIVDLPPEEDEVLHAPASLHGLSVVRFVTPTSDETRLKTILDGASGYLYYISMAGITGTKPIDSGETRAAIEALRRKTSLPCTVGFGIRSPEQAAAIARFADGAVVGTAIVSKVLENINAGHAGPALVSNVAEFCRALADSVHAARSSGPSASS